MARGRGRGWRDARACLSLLLAMAQPVGAQVVRGTVRSEDGSPATGAFVRLVDDMGRQIGAVLADGQGAYQLRAPEATLLRVRVELIGLKTAETTMMRLQRGETFTWSPTLSVLPIRLDGIEVEGRRRCGRRRGDGPTTALLWEEARKALEVVRWADGEGLYRYVLLRTRRELDTGRREVFAESNDTLVGHYRRPFESRPVPDLLERGFVQEARSGRFAYAPDASVLLDAGFAANHCFAAVEGSDGMVGLSFEPSEPRGITDIAGVLWLHRATLALANVEYRYVGFPGVGPQLALGGQVEFERMPSGAWIVQRWYLEMPVIGEVRLPGAPDDGQRRVVGVVQEGGEVLEVVDAAGQAILDAGRGTIAGIVYDSARGRPIADASVLVQPLGMRAMSGRGGAFTFAGLPEGRYTLSISHPRFDSLGMELRPRLVQLEAGGTEWIELGIPTTVDGSAQNGPNVLGEVLGVGGEAIPGALVTLVDADGTALGSAITDVRGTFEVPLPVEGRYRAQVQAVGWAKWESRPFPVGSGTRLLSLVSPEPARTVELHRMPLASACMVHPGRDTGVGIAWSDVLTSLRLVDHTARELRHTFDLTLYSGVGDGQASEGGAPGLVDEEVSSQARVRHRFPEPPQLATGPSFVIARDSSYVAYTPSPELLASSWFEDHHCLRLEDGSKGAGEVAVSFEPVRQSGDHSVRGSFVIARSTGEPSSLHYEVEARGMGVVFGGWMTFANLPDGGRYVSAWERRLPLGVRLRDADAPRVTRHVTFGVAAIYEGGWVSRVYDQEGRLVQSGGTTDEDQTAIRNAMWMTWTAVLAEQNARAGSH